MARHSSATLTYCFHIECRLFIKSLENFAMKTFSQVFCCCCCSALPFRKNACLAQCFAATSVKEFQYYYHLFVCTVHTGKFRFIALPCNEICLIVIFSVASRNGCRLYIFIFIFQTCIPLSPNVSHVACKAAQRNTT